MRLFEPAGSTSGAFGAMLGAGEVRMFGLSLSKLLFTIFVVIAVWKAFAYVGQLARAREQANAVRRRPASPFKAAGGRTIDLVECPRCGAYVDPREGCHCGRARA
jgi:hypothetical protein